MLSPNFKEQTTKNTEQISIEMYQSFVRFVPFVVQYSIITIRIAQNDVGSVFDNTASTHSETSVRKPS